MRSRRASHFIARPLNCGVIRPTDMPSANNKRFQQALADALKSRGFKKDGATWRSIHQHALGVINLQGSQWGPSFYVNLGVYFPAIGSNSSPSEAHCHIRTRLTELVPNRSMLIELLDFEKPVPEDARNAELESAVVDYALPWLERVSTLDGAREYCNSLPARSPWVTADARKYLALVPSV